MRIITKVTMSAVLATAGILGPAAAAEAAAAAQTVAAVPSRVVSWHGSQAECEAAGVKLVAAGTATTWSCTLWRSPDRVLIIWMLYADVPA